MFTKATKKQAKLRMAIHGPSGAGKTYSALRIATAMGKRIALIDTERGSASKYSDRFTFDVAEVGDPYHPQRLLDALAAAGDAGYDCVVLDSLTHFWNGPGGFLELVDEEVKKQRARGHKPDSFAAWKPVDALYRRLIQAILSSPMHVFATLRAKTEYEKSEGANGKTQIRKLGMAPEFRAQSEYEFDVEGMLDIEHNLVIGKTRCDALDGRAFTKPGEDVAKILLAWLNDGVAAHTPLRQGPAAAAPAAPPEPKADASAPALPTGNPQQEATLAALLRRLAAASLHGDPVNEIESLAEVVAGAKADLRGQYLDAFRKAHAERYTALKPQATKGAA